MLGDSRCSFNRSGGPNQAGDESAVYELHHILTLGVRFLLERRLGRGRAHEAVVAVLEVVTRGLREDCPLPPQEVRLRPDDDSIAGRRPLGIRKLVRRHSRREARKSRDKSWSTCRPGNVMF